MVRQLTLIAYKVENDSIVLYQVGPHENFYKNLKKIFKKKLEIKNVNSTKKS